MGRNRIPTAVQEAKGAFRKDPQRKSLRGDIGADGKAKPAGCAPIGDPPARLKGKGAELWYELIVLVPAGVLNGSHRWWLENACQLMAKSLRGKITGGERGLLMKALSGMGLSPVDASKVTASRETENEFAEFASTVQ